MTTRPYAQAAAAMAVLVVGCAAPTKTSSGSAEAAPRPVVAAQMSPGGKGTSIPVSNAGFEDLGDDRLGRNCPPKWWCTLHADRAAFRFASVPGEATSRVLRVERVKPEPWALVTQSLPSSGLAGRVLRVSVDVKTSAMVAGPGAGAGPVVRVFGPGGVILASERMLRPPGAGWARLGVDIVIPAGPQLIDVGVAMYGGGIAEFDNVTAEHRAK